MQYEHLGFWSFPTQRIFLQLIKLYYKSIWENQVLKLFLWALEAKHIILNKYNCSEHPVNVKDTE